MGLTETRLNSMTTEMIPAELAADDFRARLNEVFRIHAGDQVVEAELVEVAGLSGYSARPDRSPFSLVFRGPQGVALEQAICRFTNDKMGELDMFLVCVGPDPEDRQMRYEVIFT
jgi:hypothetical protein